MSRATLFLGLLLHVAAPTVAPDPVLIAHRGASFDAPENTFAAWDLALEQGADWIEQDLQFTRDRVLVVFHDDTLDRVARGPAEDCQGPIREKTLAQLSVCDVGSWFNAEYADRARPEFVGLRIPTLDQVLERYGARARLYLEIKAPDEAPGIEEALRSSLERHRMIGAGADSGRLIVQSFSRASLERFHLLAPDVPLVQLIEDPIISQELDSTLTAIAAYARGIGPARLIVGPILVEAAHAKGLFVHPYTVNTEALAERFLSLGVDGLFTDRPGLLRSVRRR